MDLTTINGCYAKYLDTNMAKIKAIFINKSSSLENIKDFVKAIVEPAYYNATAKQRFLGYLDACTSKKAVYVLCLNSVKKAKNFNPENNNAKKRG